ncbi:MAG: NAD-dependent malic enzyme [Acidimicrobiales bacterium]
MFSRLATTATRDGQRVFETAARGYEVLRDPMLNKGSAFSASEREALGLVGLLPDAELTDMTPQLDRTYAIYSAQPTDLAKHLYLMSLHDTNVTLFYALIQRHLLEMLPVAYDPVVGEAIEAFSQVFSRARGVFLSIDKVDEIESSLRAFGAGPDDIDLLVASDAEEILGIGDWGANGIDICIGKLAVYTAAAGIDPHRVIPVMLDAGTNRESLLNDPLYIGRRHSRAHGSDYDAFVDAYVAAAHKLFPKAMLHWEDFGSSTCRRILERHRESVSSFNDDMQGTGAITMSGLYNAVKLAGTEWREQRVVIVGGGTAGCGIADKFCDQMVRDGLTAAEAASQIWIVDLPGLLTDDMTDGLLDYQRPYVRPAEDVVSWKRTTPQINNANMQRWPAMATLQAAAADAGIIDLAAVVAEVHPTILIGTSTTPGRFTQAIVKSMAAHVDRPIVFPLSNPTPLAEATPHDLLTWTGGKALVATGSPFDDVEVDGTVFKIGQANNAALYPGLGLGVIVARAAKVTDEMISAAARAVADEADLSSRGAALLPSNGELRTTSSIVAVQVVIEAQRQGVARAEIDDVVEAVREAQWWPVYVPVVAI